MYDIIIIGSGPSGMSSAIYASRASKKVLILESKSYGGQIINTNAIENYPGLEHISGFDYATALYNQVKKLNVDVIFEEAIKIKNNKDFKEVITSQNKYKCKSIIIASGCSNKLLNLENEKELIGNGISYCAICDGAFYKNKNVAVVGGGNSALEDALYLSDLANKVYVIHRRNEFKADNITIEKLKLRNNVEYIYNANVSRLNKSNNKLESIEVTFNDNSSKKILIDCLFIAIGKKPQTDNFLDIIKTDQYGYIITDEYCHTNIDGIFASGDNRVKEVRQLVTAVSDGAIAALEAVKYINKQ